MMSGLMLIFLFIAISFMIETESQKQEMRDIAISYRDTKANLNETLYEEFENDLERWNANITEDNHIVFASPELLFEVSKSKITDEFKTILEEFFARYITVLTAKGYKNEILEVKVEGHTSKRWDSATSPQEIYLNNMKLSQNRAYEVLVFCYSLKDNVINENRVWIQKHFRANGMAFSQLKDVEKARRVEFSITLKSEDKVYKILK